MSKRSRLMIAVFSAWLAMALAPLAHATTGTIEVGCEGVRFTGRVAEGAIGRLEVRLHETADWQSPRLQDDIFSIGSGPFDVFVPWADPDGQVDGQLFRVVIFVSANGDSHFEPLAFQEGILECEPPPPGEEGCTPGYWKNHLEDWPPTGYSPSDDFDTTFGGMIDLFDPDITLEEAVNLSGGGIKKLARHGTAALLSAGHPDVNYPYTVAEVMSLLLSGNSDALANANELGCSIP